MKGIVKVDNPIFEIDGRKIFTQIHRNEDFPGLEKLQDGETLYWYSRDRWYIHNSNKKEQPEPKFRVGDKACKPKGYKFPCTIVSVFKTVNGDVRVVAEMDEYGLLHIFNEQQLEHYKHQYDQIIDTVYQTYIEDVKNSIDLATSEGVLNSCDSEGYNWLSKESFISRIKTDDQFSKKFGLKIKERELDLNERRKLVTPEMHSQIYNAGDSSTLSSSEIDQWGVPSKQITITYNNETFQFYEN